MPYYFIVMSLKQGVTIVCPYYVKYNDTEFSYFTLYGNIECHYYVTIVSCVVTLSVTVMLLNYVLRVICSVITVILLCHV